MWLCISKSFTGSDIYCIVHGTERPSTDKTSNGNKSPYHTVYDIPADRKNDTLDQLKEWYESL